MPNEEKVQFICYACEETLDGEAQHHDSYSRPHCESCYNELHICSSCDERFSYDETIQDGNDTSVCLGCRENYSICVGCNTWVHDEDSNYCEDCDSVFCSDCGCSCSEDPGTRDWGSPERGDINQAKEIKSTRMAGVELECYGGDYDVLRKLPSGCGYYVDGSIHGDNPIEVQTPPASADKLEQLLEKTVSALNIHGFDTNGSCGLHVHIEAEDLKQDNNLAIKVFATYYALEPIIWAMLPAQRRTSHWCKPLGEVYGKREQKTTYVNIGDERVAVPVDVPNAEDVISCAEREDKKWLQKTSRFDKYMGLNMSSMFTEGHLELRYHHGTLEHDKIKNWVRLHLYLIDNAVANYDKAIIDTILQESTLEGKLNKFIKKMKPDKALIQYIKACIEANR